MKQRDIFVELRKKAKSNHKRIILPEGRDERVLQAARKILKENIARLIIFGGRHIKENFEDELNSGNLEIIDIEDDALIDRYAAFYFELRKHRGVDFESARKIIRENSVYIASLMVRKEAADGFVAGAGTATSEVARAAIHCIGKLKSLSTVMGVFVMVVPDSVYGAGGIFVFSDCAVLPRPDAVQLSDIAGQTANFTREILNIVPCVAMLSYSTKGSSSSERIKLIVEATHIVREKYPELLIEGELQADAAIVPEVAALKAPKSEVAGHSNVLIFPNLEAANCSYKLVQRLAQARAVGPIFLGLRKPVSDLSRGCSVEDIVDATAITVVRAQIDSKCIKGC